MARSQLTIDSTVAASSVRSTAKGHGTANSILVACIDLVPAGIPRGCSVAQFRSIVFINALILTAVLAVAEGARAGGKSATGARRQHAAGPTIKLEHYKKRR